jgi:hypothetical protein
MLTSLVSCAKISDYSSGPVDPASKASIKRWYNNLMNFCCISKGKSSGRPSTVEQVDRIRTAASVRSAKKSIRRTSTELGIRRQESFVTHFGPNFTRYSCCCSFQKKTRIVTFIPIWKLEKGRETSYVISSSAMKHVPREWNRKQVECAFLGEEEPPR